MTKDSTTTSRLKDSDLAEGWLDHPFVEQLIARKQWLMWGALALFILLIGTYRFVTQQTINAENDFFQAQSEFLQIKDDSLTTVERSGERKDLRTIDDIMNRHPELHAKYDGAIAQLLLIEGQVAQSKPYVNRTLERTKKEDMSLYHDFSRTSLLVAENSYDEALGQSLLLQEKLNVASEQHVILQGYNLIRIASLYQALDRHDEEKQAWNQVSALSEKQPEAFAKVSQSFKNGAMNLNKYIETRMSP